MAIQRTKKQSDLEKRLKLLHRQVYGHPSGKLVHRSTEELTYRNTETPASKPSILTASDTAFLGQDLLKILLFSSLAIGIQVTLFFLIKNGFIFNIF